MRAWIVLIISVSLWVLGFIVIADEHVRTTYMFVQVVIESPLCEAPPGQVRPSWPLPSGCDCFPWSCWLSGRTASAAQDLGIVDREAGVHHWLMLVPPDELDAVKKSRNFVALREDYTLENFPEAAKTFLVEIESDRCLPDAGTMEVDGFSAGFQSEFKRCKISLSEYDERRDTLIKEADLPGSFSGVSVEASK